MTSEQLAKICAENERAWSHDNPNCPTDVATYMMTSEVAYQLALLNEGLQRLAEGMDRVMGPYPMMRVMVEPGEYPLRVKNSER